MKNLGIIGIIGRFKPLHNGAALMFDYACKNSDKVIIGIGSSNKYDVRNPFTAEESRDMIDSYLSKRYSNYSFLFIPDSGHIPEYSGGQEWRKYVLSNFGKLDYLFTGNRYVLELLKDDYCVMHPSSMIPRDDWFVISGTEVRINMARDKDWKNLVPKEVVEYIEHNNLDKRFRKEFGLETLANLSDPNLFDRSLLNEKHRVGVLNGNR